VSIFSKRSRELLKLPVRRDLVKDDRRPENFVLRI
jgi:hypothetical protein